LCLLQVAAVAASVQSSNAVLDRIKKNGAIPIGYREASSPSPISTTHASRSTDICLKVPDAVCDKLPSPQLSVNWVPVNL
jgi:hypothetical protein